MLEGNWCHRVLLPVAVALIMTIVTAFGLAPTSVAADPADDSGKVTTETKTKLTVTDVEPGVVGTAYKYISVGWNTTENVPSPPEYMFENGVATWMKGKAAFKDYFNDKSVDKEPTDKFKRLGASEMRDYTDALLAGIVKKEVVLTGKADEHTFASSPDGNTSISFHLPMGGYVISLSNGPNCIYQPIAIYVWPQATQDGKYELKIGGTGKSADTSVVEAKSKKITSTKTVRMKGNETVDNEGQASHGQVGDSFLFKVTTPIPHYPTEAVNQEFIVQDQPTSGLTVTPSSAKVWIVGKGNGGEGRTENLTETTDYSTEDVAAQSGNNSGRGFQVKFSKEQYRNKLADAGKNGKSLVIEYTGTLDSKAPVKGGAKNSAHPLIPKDFYTTGAGFASPSPTPAVATVYTYGVKLTKVGKKGKKASKPRKLQGAEFKLYKGVQNGNREGAEVHVKEQRKADAAATGEYVVQAGTGGEATTTLVSGPDGLLQIDGLGAGTYILKEIKPPAGGYTLPAESIAIVIKDSNLDGTPDTGSGNNGSTIDGKPASVDNDNRLTYNLTNKKADFRLPKTGAIGAVIFGVFGVVLIVTSAVLVVAHRRRKTKKAQRSS